MSVVEVNHLTKDYGSARGVFDISFQIQEGEVFGFLGPNGAGKSTTIRHLMGFSKPDKGNTKILGLDSFENYSDILNKVGYIPGEIALPQGLTGKEFIKMMQDMYHIHNDNMLKKMLSLFELDENTLSLDTKYMSLGVKRKLAVVTAFMSDPQVLILDEPTSGLDPVMQKKFIDFIKEEKSRNKTILLSSHIFSEVDATCERIAIIKDGVIVSEFLANDLKHATKKQYEISFYEKNDYSNFINNNVNNLINIVNRNNEKNELLISCDDSKINEVIAYIANYRIKDFHHRKETLENYFMKYYKEEKEFGGNF